MSMADGLWPISSEMAYWESHICLSVTVIVATYTIYLSSYLWRGTKFMSSLLPPHTSHLLQPLDKTPFAQFKLHWEKHLTQYNNQNKGKSLNKVDFWDVFTLAFNAAMSLKNILSGFKKTGISPYDPYVIPIHEMGPSNVTEKGSLYI